MYISEAMASSIQENAVRGADNIHRNRQQDSVSFKFSPGKETQTQFASLGARGKLKISISWRNTAK